MGCCCFLVFSGRLFFCWMISFSISRMVGSSERLRASSNGFSGDGETGCAAVVVAWVSFVWLRILSIFFLFAAAAAAAVAAAVVDKSGKDGAVSISRLVLGDGGITVACMPRDAIAAWTAGKRATGSASEGSRTGVGGNESSYGLLLLAGGDAGQSSSFFSSSPSCCNA